MSDVISNETILEAGRWIVIQCRGGRCPTHNHTSDKHKNTCYPILFESYDYPKVRNVLSIENEIDFSVEPKKFTPVVVKRHEMSFRDESHIVIEGRGLESGFSADPQKCKTMREWLGPRAASAAYNLLHRLDNALFVRNRKLSFFRICGDRETHYGDGGYDRLQYPILCGRQLLDERAQQKLSTQLDLLCAEQDDYHEMEPVADIIDPNLFPLRIARTEEELNNANFAMLDMKIAHATKKSDRRSLEQLRFNLEGRDVLDSSKERIKYQWLPAEVDINQSGRAEFVSDIHQKIPRNKNKELYAQLERLLSNMVPLFAELGHIKRKDKKPTDQFERQLDGSNNPRYVACRRQFVIKSQRTELRRGEGYAGHWHVEGLTEGVAAVGVYYARVDEGIVGGNVKFRPHDLEDDHYDFDSDACARVKLNSCIVFDNMPHRVRKMENQGELDLAMRTTVQFFLIDPAHRIQSLQLPISPPQFSSVQEAKAFRAVVRKVTSGPPQSGFCARNYGNCGVRTFARGIDQANCEEHYLRNATPANQILIHSVSEEASP